MHRTFISSICHREMNCRRRPQGKFRITKYWNEISQVEKKMANNMLHVVIDQDRARSNTGNSIWNIILKYDNSLRWRHNERDSVSNHQPHDCLLNRLFRRRSKKTSKLRVTGLCGGNSPGTGEFPAQMASYAENVSIWWRHHVCIELQNTLCFIDYVGIILASGSAN